MVVEFLIGLTSGVISGSGMGGGTILILLLSLLKGLDQFTAQAVNIVFFVPTAIIAIWINMRQKVIDKDIAKKMIIFGVIGSVIGGFIAMKIDTKILRKIFAIFILIIAAREIYMWFRKYILHKDDKKDKKKEIIEKQTT